MKPHCLLLRPYQLAEGAQILQNRGHTGTIPAKEAVQAARENPAKEHGGDRRSEEAKEQPNNVRLEQPEYGNRTDYTLRRLARDRPDLLDRVEAGDRATN